jgi:hypothetical protein
MRQELHHLRLYHQHPNQFQFHRMKMLKAQKIKNVKETNNSRDEMDDDMKLRAVVCWYDQLLEAPYLHPSHPRNLGLFPCLWNKTKE